MVRILLVAPPDNETLLDLTSAWAELKLLLPARLLNLRYVDYGSDEGLIMSGNLISRKGRMLDDARWLLARAFRRLHSSKIIRSAMLFLWMLLYWPALLDALFQNRIPEFQLARATVLHNHSSGGQLNRTRREHIRGDAAVSRNISQVLENLLQNYESSQLPTHGQGKPTVVKTNMLIRSMGPVSELDMEYSMDCYFRQYWRDQRLSFRGPINSLSLNIKMLERIWRPDTYFYNGKNSYVHTITVPNKLLRISQDGDILYSMRLTIKAKCPMVLRSFPMDRQSCPLVLGSFYQWQSESSVNFEPGMTLSQFDLISYPQRNATLRRREGEFSVLQVHFNLQRHTGYFIIQVYVPCVLIVVLSWVSFWIHREATSDRVGLGITTVLTLSTISLDSRKDLPKVRYATALDWFLLMSFGYCIATLLEFAGVHYFTKVIGSGEIPVDEEEWEEQAAAERHEAAVMPQTGRRRSSLLCPIYNDTVVTMQNAQITSPVHTRMPSTMERHTQTEQRIPGWRQLLYCITGNEWFRRQRQRQAGNTSGMMNSVSQIDRAARILFPASFGLLNFLYWVGYVALEEDFAVH
ncbi:hypothetical protein B566_EDAN004937 [Ephemera danica]|nr:hypothetical protein B566_EDAN004937 [Ephemera danica]